MKEKLISDIIKALKISNPDLNTDSINAQSKFMDIPNMDSMSIVNFQMDLASVIGDKANDVQIVVDMTIGDLADILESL